MSHPYFFIFTSDHQTTWLQVSRLYKVVVVPRYKYHLYTAIHSLSCRCDIGPSFPLPRCTTTLYTPHPSYPCRIRPLHTIGRCYTNYTTHLPSCRCSTHPSPIIVHGTTVSTTHHHVCNRSTDHHNTIHRIYRSTVHVLHLSSMYGSTSSMYGSTAPKYTSTAHTPA